MKCLEMGMKREAVQEERNRGAGGGGGGAPASQKDMSGEMEPTRSRFVTNRFFWPGKKQPLISKPK